MLDGRWRAGVERGLGPVGDRLRKMGVTADALTVFGLLCSIGTAVLVATGHLGWAVLGIVLAGLGDLLDGAVARGGGQAGPRGSFFDSVTDRVSDAVILGGVAWYFAGVSAHLPVLAFAVAACSMLISYERAKAESLGLSARGGLMERAERFVLLGAGLAFGILVEILWVMLVLTAITAVDRFRRVWREAARPPRKATVHPLRPARRLRGTGAIGSTGSAAGDGTGSDLRAWWERHRPVERRRERPAAARRTRP